MNNSFPTASPPRRRSRPGKTYDQTNFNIFVAYHPGIPVHGQPGAAADAAAEWRAPNGGAWATRCSTRRTRTARRFWTTSIRDYARMTGALAAEPAGGIQCRAGATCGHARYRQPAQGDGQGPRGSVLQPDGAVLQRDGHLRPRRIARLLFLVQFVRDPATRCGVARSDWPLSFTPTGLVYRMVLEGRPPVTNLYSSAIFIGWGACLLGIDSGKISQERHRRGRSRRASALSRSSSRITSRWKATPWK